MALKRHSGKITAARVAFKTTIFESPGAMLATISMSSETSTLPLLAPVVGVPLKLSSKPFATALPAGPPPFRSS